MMVRTTKQIREMMQVCNNNMDFIIYDTMEWVLVSELKKQIEAEIERNKPDIDDYDLGRKWGLEFCLELCNSSEQTARDTKNGSPTPKGVSVFGEHNTGEDERNKEADIRCHKGSKMLLPSSDTSSSPVHNPLTEKQFEYSYGVSDGIGTQVQRKCTCHHTQTEIELIKGLKGHHCVRCGGALK
jgi:hypothetical protein